MQPNEIRELRLKLGLTQEALAHKIGTEKARISDWERGKWKPSKPYLILLNQLKNK